METIRKCSRCGSEYKINPGLSNWKRLFRKPTMEDWITLVILILLVATSYAYQHDTKICRETLQNLDTVCAARTSVNVMPNYSSSPNLNMPNITISYER